MTTTCVIPVVSGVDLDARVGCRVGTETGWGASFTLSCFMKFPPEAAWGNRFALRSDPNYPHGTANPFQSVLYKCLSILFSFSHITKNPGAGWCFTSSADRHYHQAPGLSFYMSVAPSLMHQFSPSTPHDHKMAMSPSFPIQGRKRGLGAQATLLAICSFKIWKAEKFKRFLFMCYWAKLCHMTTHVHELCKVSAA